jgi:hypothetical protein
MSKTTIPTGGLADSAVTSAKITDATIATADIADSAVTLAKTSGVGGDLSFGGDTFGADKTIGSNDNYALKFETNGTERLELTNDGRGLSQFTAKAWATCDASGTVAIDDSHNISSLADPESGQLVHNFANNMANSDYTIVVNAWQGYSYTFGGMDMSTTAFKAVQSNGSAYVDTNRVHSLVFGD